MSVDTTVEVKPGSRGLARLLTLVIALSVFAASTVSFAQDPDAKKAAQTPDEKIEDLAGTDTSPTSIKSYSLSELQTLLKQAESATEIEDDVKSQIKTIIQSAIDQRNRIDELTAKSTKLHDDTQTIQERIDALQKALEEARDQPVPTISPEFTLAELIQRRSQLNSRLTDFKKDKTQLEGLTASRDELPQQFANQRKSIEASQKEAFEELNEIGDRELANGIKVAKRVELQVRIAKLASESAMLTAETNLSRAEDKLGFQRMRLALAVQSIERIESELKLLSSRITQLEAEEAAIRVQQARQSLIDAAPSLQPYAATNKELAVESQDLIAPVKDANDRLVASIKRHEDLKAQLEQTRLQYSRRGSTDSLGALLRKQRTLLPSRTALREMQVEQNDRIDQIQFKFFDYESESRRYDSQSFRNATIESLVPSAKKEEALQSQEETEAEEVLRNAATELVNARQDYLNQLVNQYDDYINVLARLDRVQQDTIETVNECRNFIDSRVLWIRTSPPIYESITDADADLWLFKSDFWDELYVRLPQDMLAHSTIWLLALTAIVIMRFFKRRAIRYLKELGTVAARGNNTDFKPTLQVMGITLLLSFPWIMLVFFVSWRIRIIAGSNLELRSFGNAMAFTGHSLLLVEILRNSARGGGLLESHLGYNTVSTASLRRNLWLLYALAIPINFFEQVLHGANPDFGRDSVARILFICVELIWAYFLKRLTNPKNGIFADYFNSTDRIWLYRARYVLWSFIIGGPLILAALTFQGFYYTGRELSDVWQTTVRLILIAFLVRDSLHRSILLQRRKLAMEQARERRALMLEARAAEEEGDSSQPKPLTPEQMQFDLQADLSAQSQQTTKLVNVSCTAAILVGSWMIWVDVLPALGVLDSWTIWTTTVQSEITPEGGGETIIKTVPQDVTAGQLALSILIAAVTLVAFRNFPGFMEMSFLQRLPLDPPIRYAITQLTSYGIVIVGVILSFNAISIGWTQVQYVATALTFALGFGLQEIFANFVAGLILLFEQPIRVGDIVTISNTTGTVSRIRIRATTITDYDRKEFIIPNREFITGQLLNWTLTDTINRIVIEVGVAYGTDTELARRTLNELCENHERLLKDPAPSVVFDGFKDSTLNFTIRTYLPNLDNRLRVIHELHTAIDQRFRELGIEIAFPQRDINIRSVPVELARRQSQDEAVSD